MNSFRTPIHIDTAPFSIQHKMEGLAIGSCFVYNIGGWLQKVKFNLLLNPFGITYNPISIGHQLSLLTKNSSYHSDQLFQHQEHWHSFDHHSSFSDIDKDLVVEKINNAFSKAVIQLKQADYLLLTFGTAHIYTHRKTQQVVSNCHKIPNSEFEKKRISVKEIMHCWEPIIQNLKNTSPQLKIIFTVSPIRHLKDGIVENQKSKATLLLAIDNMVRQFDTCFYFPAYEIMIDDLRDYRFYGKDMIHPSDIAIDYIKDKFADCYLDKKSRQLVDEIVKIQKAVEHKSFQPTSVAHQHFVKKTVEKMEILEKEYGFDFGLEREMVLKG